MRSAASLFLGTGAAGADLRPCIYSVLSSFHLIILGAILALFPLPKNEGKERPWPWCGAITCLTPTHQTGWALSIPDACYFSRLARVALLPLYLSVYRREGAVSGP